MMNCSDMPKRQDTTAKKEMHKEQFKHIIEAEAALQRNWGDEEVRQSLSFTQQALH